MVLFYVYPLKFLLTVLSRLVSGRGQRLDDGAAVMVGLDFGAVFLVFSLLYAHAHRLRADRRARSSGGQQSQRAACQGVVKKRIGQG